MKTSVSPLLTAPTIILAASSTFVTRKKLGNLQQQKIGHFRKEIIALKI